MIIHTVFDNKAKYYLTPFFSTTRGEGLRQFIHACNDPDHPFCQYAEDFTLLEIGTWDPHVGTLFMQAEPEPIGRAWELKRPDVPDQRKQGQIDIERAIERKLSENTDVPST